MWRWRNGKCNGNRLFRNQGSVMRARSFKKLHILYNVLYHDSIYYNRPTPTPRDEALTS
jgi:hypothetical protein